MILLLCNFVNFPHNSKPSPPNLPFLIPPGPKLNARAICLRKYLFSLNSTVCRMIIRLKLVLLMWLRLWLWLWMLGYAIGTTFVLLNKMPHRFLWRSRNIPHSLFIIALRKLCTCWSVIVVSVSLQELA